MLTAQNINLKNPAIKQKFMYLESVLEAFMKLGFNTTTNGAKHTKAITKIENEAKSLEYKTISNMQ